MSAFRATRTGGNRSSVHFRRSVAVYPIASVVLVTAAALLLSYLSLVRGLSRYAESQADERALVAADAARTLFQREIKRLESIARYVSGDREVINVLAHAGLNRGYRAMSAELLAKKLRSFGADFVEVYDDAGARVFPLRAAAGGSDPVQWQRRRRGLNGLSGAYLSLGREGLRILVAAPVLGDRGVIGVVVIGTLFDDFYASRFAHQVRADVFIATPEAIWGASNPRRRGEIFKRESINATLKEFSPQTEHDNDKNRTVVYSPMRVTDGSFVLIVEVDHSYAAEAATSIRLQSAMLLAMISALGVLVGAVLTCRLVRPLRELTVAAAERAVRYAGDFRLRPSPDEIADLKISLESMRKATVSCEQRLEQQQALHSLMAQCAQTANRNTEPDTAVFNIMERVREAVSQR